jgi:hypothetical protein
LGSIDLIAENIRINLPQVLKGEALRLIESIAVTAKVKFSETDLQASLISPILSQAITDLFTQILATSPQSAHWSVEWESVRIDPHTLILQGKLTTDGQTVPIKIAMGIALTDGHILDLDPLKINCAIDLPGSNITRHSIDLGEDVHITELQLVAGEILCQGRIQVNP